jgi:hypothetical protein
MDYRTTPAGHVRVQSMWVYCGLCLCTLGLYAFWAFARNMRTLRDFGRAKGDVQLGEIQPWTYVVGLIVGNILIIPAFIVGGVAFTKVRRLQAAVHPERQTRTVHIIWCMLFGPPVVQILLNRTWRHFDKVPDVLATTAEPVRGLPAS